MWAVSHGSPCRMRAGGNYYMYYDYKSTQYNTIQYNKVYLNLCNLVQ